MEVCRRPALRIGVGWDGREVTEGGKKAGIPLDQRQACWGDLSPHAVSGPFCHNPRCRDGWVTLTTDRCAAASKAAAVTALTVCTDTALRVGLVWGVSGGETESYMQYKTASSRVSSTYLNVQIATGPGLLSLVAISPVWNRNECLPSQV